MTRARVSRDGTVTVTAALSVARALWPQTAATERQVRELLAATCRVAGWPVPPAHAVHVRLFAPGTRRQVPDVHPRSLVDDLMAGRVGLVVARAFVQLPHRPPAVVDLRDGS